MKIEYSEFLDKVHGCWYGKCLGGAAGAPLEGIKAINDIDDFTQVFNPNLPNDDLDIQLLWLSVLENKGTLISSEELANAWMERCHYAMSEYGYFTKNYMRGIKPPYSGIVNNSFFAEGMGCPIRSEIWGIISAGNPELAVQYAYMDATLDHAENSVYAEQFLAALASMAFFDNDVYSLITKGMKFIPKESKLYRCFTKIIDIYNKKEGWLKARTIAVNEFGHMDFTNSVQNLAFVIIALLWGECDMRNTINIALKCGYDADCTCASAASIIGIIKGYSGIPKELTGLINDYFICGIDAKRESDSIKALAEDTVKIALKTPNYNIEIENSPIKEDRPLNFKGFELEKPTEEGLKKALKNITPRKWEIYGPFYEQLNQPMDTSIPSPHGEGCNLPDIVCMINNEVFLDKKYIETLSDEYLIGTVDAYDDFINVEDILKIDGQVCCYAKTTVNSPKNQKVWFMVGNNDGFDIMVNGKSVLKKDEIRLWTPFNNYALVDLIEGENEVVIKLLRRTEKLKISIGLRQYREGLHWHQCRWHTDL